jgi:SPP1 family predicted phage head-tail adaptor
MMEAGSLRHRVTIQSKSVTRDTYGGEVITWATVATVWAAVEPLNGREWLEGRQAAAEVTTRIRIRYRSGVLPEMQVVYGSHAYDILAVIQPEEKRQEIQLMCQEVIN